MPVGNCKALERFPDAYRHSQTYAPVLIWMVQHKSNFMQVRPECVCVCVYTHTHTHTYIYIYIYIYIYGQLYMHRQGCPAEIQTPTQ